MPRVKVTLDGSNVAANIKLTLSQYSEIVLNCLRKTGEVVSTRAKTHHKYKTQSGNLERATTFMVINALKTAYVYVDEEIAPYGIYVHEPTGEHFSGKRYPITPKKARALAIRQPDGGVIYRQKVMHPGSAGTYYLTEAMIDSVDEVKQIFTGGLHDIANLMRGRKL